MRLPRWVRLFVYGSAAATWVTGVLWLVFHHYVRREGPFGPEASPLEHGWLALHGAAAFLILWALGLIWISHVRRGWSGLRNRWNGRTLTMALVVLAASGWGLYYLGDELWRERLSLLHWGLGLGLGLGLPFHVWSGRRGRRQETPD